MKVAVIGATGRIGAILVENLKQANAEVISVSTSLGVSSVTGEGLRSAIAGAEVVVDVTNAASFGDVQALDFFKTSTRNLLAVSADTGVRHYLALSVVGTPRLVESDYFRAKMVQENLIRAARRPYTILHSTQFFEFLDGVINMGADGNGFRLPSALMSPVAADDVAKALTELAMGVPRNDAVEIGGREQFGIDEIARIYLTANEDTRQVVTDDSARYYGVELNDDTLLPLKGARVGSLRYVEWLYDAMAD